MKHFIDNNGLFEIRIPSTWKYSLKDGKIHTFQEYESWKFDAFQISLRENSESYDLTRVNQFNSVTMGKHVCYCLPDSTNEKFTTKSWVSLIDETIVFFTLTFSLNPVDETPLSQKLEVIKKVIAEFKIIKEKERKSQLNSYRFSMFLQGVGATAAILNKAVINKAFIEATCVLANQIDALLRIGIVLKKQIINSNSEIEIEWIYQGPNDKKKTEKNIYTKAKEIGIINESLFNKLYHLYEDRNRVVHRFIISEITIAEIETIAYNYYQLQEQINKIIFNIESEQIKLNIGMTKLRRESDDSIETTLEFIKGKIGKLDYFEENLASNKGYTQ